MLDMIGPVITVDPHIAEWLPLAEAMTESPAEAILLACAWIGGIPLVPQEHIGPYRIDFLWPDRHLAVEVDGYTYHGDQYTFGYDRKRDRDLALLGWRTVRFPATEVFDNPGACVAFLYCYEA